MVVAFRSLLPQDWDWQFVDGEEESDPAPGVDSVYPGPYSCYYVEPSTKNLQDALDLVYHVMDEEGPFDAIMGFSQVCFLNISYPFPESSTAD
jgi:hypothetical protein